MLGLEIEGYQHGKVYIHKISSLESNLISLMVQIRSRVDNHKTSGIFKVRDGPSTNVAPVTVGSLVYIKNDGSTEIILSTLSSSHFNMED